MVLDLIKTFKALGEETRLHIVEFLLHEEKCACEFDKCINKDQTTLSRHLKTLVEADILTFEKKGRNIIYSIKNEETKKFLEKIGLRANKLCCTGEKK